MKPKKVKTYADKLLEDKRFREEFEQEYKNKSQNYQAIINLLYDIVKNCVPEKRGQGEIGADYILIAQWAGYNDCIDEILGNIEKLKRIGGN